MSMQAAIYERTGGEAGARRAGIWLVVQDLVAIGASRLIVEGREGRDRMDRRTIREALLDAGAIDELDYEHMRPSEEPRLWVADAVAWAYATGQTCRRRVGGIVEVVRRVDP
jgi:hypothetical protein